MQTMKTVVVIGLLSMVMYGVYTVLTEPDSMSPQALENKPAGSSPRGLDEPFLEERFESAFDETSSPSTPIAQRDSESARESLAREPVPIDPTAGDSDPTPAKPGVAFQAEGQETDAVTMADSFIPGAAVGVPTVEGTPGRVTPATISEAAQRRQPPTTDTPDATALESASNVTALDSQATVVEPLDTEQSALVAADSQQADEVRGAGSSGRVLPETAARMFEVQWGEAQEQINKGKFRDALAGISKYFNHNALSSEQHERLLGLLDPLAGKVVYSAEHLILPMHKVGQHETLADIAERYQVPWQLLQNINAVRNPAALVPGTELKVVPGPFRAEVDLSHGELAVFVGELYAGRFVFASGSDPSPSPGEYVVKEKRRQRDYVGLNGKAWPATDPENPYGKVWLDLGQRICIHGSPLTATSKELPTGCISLAPRDANDVFAILSAGSRVRIHR